MMTASIAAEFSYPLHATRPGDTRRSRSRAIERVTRNPSLNWRDALDTLTRPDHRTGYGADEASPLTSPPGLIGGAVIHAARRSAGLTRRRLARTLAVGSGTVRQWENGSTPLFCVEYSELRRLAEVLSQAGATVGCDVGELTLASQCDLLVTGMLRVFEDYAEVPPVDEDGAEGAAARDLLHWALAGVPPQRYRPFAAIRPLLAAQDLTAFAALARELSAGSLGNQLAGFGATLAALSVR